MNIKKFICYLKAIPFFVKMKCNKDFFVPHFFVEVGEYPAKIFVNKKTGKFRIADSYAHEFDEKFESNAIITGLQCKYCGYITAEYKILNHYMGTIGKEEMKSLYWKHYGHDAIE